LSVQGYDKTNGTHREKQDFGSENSTLKNS